MGGITKFKTFSEAQKFTQEELYERGFDSDRTGKYFRELAGLSKNPYRSGLYKFKSFKAAREFDLELIIKMAIGGDA